MKQILHVLKAVSEGAETSRDVVDFLLEENPPHEITIASASACLSALCEDGLIRKKAGRGPMYSTRGRRSNMYTDEGVSKAK